LQRSPLSKKPTHQLFQNQKYYEELPEGRIQQKSSWRHTGTSDHAFIRLPSRRFEERGVKKELPRCKRPERGSMAATGFRQKGSLCRIPERTYLGRRRRSWHSQEGSNLSSLFESEKEEPKAVKRTKK
jgi:hypothetical protein